MALSFTRKVNMSPGQRDTGDVIDAGDVNELQEALEDISLGTQPIPLPGIAGALGERDAQVGTYNVADYETPAAAFAAAHAAESGTVYFPAGTYTPPSNAATGYSRIYGWAITKSNINVELASGAVIDGSGLGTLAAAIEVQGTRTASVAAVSADITAGDNEIEVSDASALSAGDTIAIRSSGEVYCTERVGYVKAEHATISAIDGTTVTLTGPVLLDYDATDAYTVAVDLFDMPENIAITGDGAIRMNTSDRHYGIRAFYARNVVVSVNIEQSDEMGVEFLGCRDVIARDMRTDNIIRSGLGYGVRFTGCDNGQAIRITGRNTRHLLDCEGAVSDLPVSTNITYDLGRAYDTTGGAFSSHAGCYDVTMRDCEGVRCNGFFISRARHSTLINPKGRGMRYTAGQGEPHGLIIGETTDGTGNAGEHLVVTGMDFDCTYDASVSTSAHGIYAFAPLSGTHIAGRISGFRDHGAIMQGLTMRDSELDLRVDCSNQNGADGDFLYGVWIFPKTAANGNNQKGVRGTFEVTNPKRHAVRWQGNDTDADPSDRLELTVVERDMTAEFAVVHMFTGYFENVIVKECIAPNATGLASGGSRYLIGVTGANHASGPFYFRNLIASTMYVQGTTAYA